MLRRILLLPALLILAITSVILPTAIADPAPGKTLVGAWIVEISPVGLDKTVDITVVHVDGTVSNSDSILGTGHGIWQRLGAKQETEAGENEISPSTFQVRFKTPILEGNSLGLPGGFILTVTSTVTLDKSGNVAEGPFETTVGPPGFPPDQGFFGEVRFTRMSFDN
jgi:hypothetical protein